ncbi:MAG: nucleotidyltransferase family protein [Clostridia bacterium]|nr:nucleotidyltransferase family protein [Clostridia bacterium]
MTEYPLLDAISNSLWHHEYPPAVASDLLSEAQLQAVDGLIQPPSYERIASYIRYCYEEGELVKLLQTKGILAVILKGSASAVYYPVPAGRSFGDIDFIVSPTRYFETTKLLEANSYTRGADEERHISYYKNGLRFELHRYYSHEDEYIEKCILDGIEHRVMGRINEHEFPMLPPLENGLVLLDHMRSHLRGGLGLRQIIDWMMFCDKVLDDDFWYNCFRPVADRTGLLILAKTTTALCQKYLGLKQTITWCSDAKDDLIDKLLESLISSGNFGSKQGLGANAERITAAIKRQGLFRYLQQAGEKNWRAYRKHPWLRPFCWVFQVFRLIRRGFRRVWKLRSDIKRGKDRYKLLNKLGI